MKLNIFSDNFELLADAPNGVPKLREMILQLAVQGKLVPQDPKDEPASVLCKRITAEKERLVKEKKIKKTKALTPIEAVEQPYNLPEGWMWQRLDQVFYPLSTSKKKIKTKDILKLGEFPVVDQGQQYISGYSNEKNKLIKIPGPVIVFGDHTREIKLIDFNFIAGADGIKILCPILMNEKYFYWVLKGLRVESRGYSRHYKFLLNNLFPVPPLNEQKRIVAKVDQLMALCDELEARKNKRNESRIVLNDAALDRLLTAKPPNEFTKHLQRVNKNFDLLYDNPENVDKLRQAILQLAVQGKLVPQDPNDEPASVLFEKIKAERERLVKEKKVKREKHLAPIKEDEMPFELPKGWEWKKLGELCIVKGGKRVPKGYQLLETKTPFVYIRVTDMKNMTINKTNLRYISKDIHNQIKNYIINKDDVYITIAGTIGGVGEVPDMFDGANLTENAAKLMFSGFNKKYFIWTLNSDIIQEQFQNSFKQMAQPKLALNKIALTLFPLPPLNEQNFIVAKVDQLMALCDELETKLSQSQSDCDELLSAIVNGIAN